MQTPQAVTAAVKRAIREGDLAARSVSTRRTPQWQWQTTILTEGDSDNALIISVVEWFRANCGVRPDTVIELDS